MVKNKPEKVAQFKPEDESILTFSVALWLENKGFSKVLKRFLSAAQIEVYILICVSVCLYVYLYAGVCLLCYRLIKREIQFDALSEMHFVNADLIRCELLVLLR